MMVIASQNPVISVIIPVYNAEKFLAKAVESILNQTYPHVELILINDGSTDSSEELCNRFANDDQRVRVVCKENAGPAAARNFGLTHATGDYIFFLDADDFVTLDTLEKLVGASNEYQPDMVMGNFSKLENNGQIVEQKVTFKTGDAPCGDKIKQLGTEEVGDYIRHFLNHPSNHLISYCWSRLYKHKTIKDHNLAANESMQLFEDFVFNLNYLKVSKTVVFVNETFYHYVMHNTHVSASMSILDSQSLLHDMNIFHDEIIRHFENLKTDNRTMTQISKEIGHALVHYSIIFIVRSCRKLTKANKGRIYTEISKLLRDPIMIESLKCYTPSKGNSRVLPFLMKLRLVRLVMAVSHYKAVKRYGILQGD